MRTLIVVESMWGNTRAVADAVAQALPGDVTVVDVAKAPDPLPEVDLVLLGGPTHAFSMSRAETRADAVGRGATGDPATGIREWLGGATPVAGLKVATFGSRVDKALNPDGAAKAAAKAARKRGFDVVGHQSFNVVGMEGPLEDGELERAATWARGVAARVTGAEA